MLNRDQQKLLAALGSAMAADALLDTIRDRGTLQGGRSAPQDAFWISYNRKAVWLEDHSEVSARFKAGGDGAAPDAGQDWRQIKPKVVLKVSWAEAAAYGASLSSGLLEELAALRATERDESRRWSEFSDERGGWPHRRRFNSDEEHRLVQAEWDAIYNTHLSALRTLWGRQRSAIERALPLTCDDEPVDLLELLDQQPATQSALHSSPVHQAAALRVVTRTPSPDARSQEGLFSLPAIDQSIGR